MNGGFLERRVLLISAKVAVAIQTSCPVSSCNVVGRVHDFFLLLPVPPRDDSFCLRRLTFAFFFGRFLLATLATTTGDLAGTLRLGRRFGMTHRGLLLLSDLILSVSRDFDP